ncbi:type III-A CRISPR-associated RAMP protein Csm4 [Arcticibacterium luteifluviistationis]|uniref:CRISPR system Cms protein Csm4 n=1 Tax=Arcticibacterium luteifluviistationis TaxID=1784714 RepID=A0A2Z4G8V3_9BACT|nr:hypothetical protein [Arcticibacterium luteifluviistationis]AWV97679.1 hypothetical protein DJ013_05670 [Arcticibacterium luteifluviistationis]
MDRTKVNIAKIFLEPYSRFHFGEYKIDHDLSLSDSSFFCHSDTLFSALINQCDRLNDDPDSFVEAFKEDEICISSVFYFFEKANCDPIYLLPKPVFIDKKVKISGAANKKQIQGVKFVSKAVWDKGFEYEKWNDIKSYVILQGNIVLTKEEYDQFGFNRNSALVKKNTRPKNQVRRPKKQARRKEDGIYYQTDVMVCSPAGVKAGIYFFYDVEDENTKRQFFNAVNVLCFSGLGGEQALLGRTPRKVPDFDQSLSFDSNKARLASISLFSPTDEAELAACTIYETSLRGGHKSGLSQNTDVVPMVMEGAEFTSSAKGCLVDLSLLPEKPIFRNGKVFLLPFESK